MATPARRVLAALLLAAVGAKAQTPAPWPGVATSALNISVTPSFLSSGVVTFNMAVEKTFASDDARFVFHGPTSSPSTPSWTSTFTAHNWNSAKCNVLASLAQEGTFIAGGIEAATTSSFDLNAFCTEAVCPGSLVQDCGFSQSPGVLNSANLRYYGKLEVWLENAAHSLLVGFYDIAIELPLNAQAVAGAGLPITVTLNTNLVTVNTPVTGLGLLKSYLMLCPGQDVPQQLSGGNVIGNLTDASGVTDVYVGETYCMQHVIPQLPSNVALVAQSLYSNGTQVQTVPAFPGTGVAQYASYTSGQPVYGSVVQFYYTFTNQGLNQFTSTVNFTALPSNRVGGGVPLQTYTFVGLPMTPAALLIKGAQIATGALQASTPPAGRRLLGMPDTAPARRLLQAPSSTYAQALAQAAFQPVEKGAIPPPPPPSPPPPTPLVRAFGSF